MRNYQVRQRGDAWRDGYEACLIKPESLLEGGGGYILQQSRRTTVGVVRLDGAEVVLKIFDESELGLWLQGWFLGSAAKRASNSAAQVAKAGFRVPALVAVLECRGWFGCRKSCFATLLVPGRPVDEAWQGLGPRERPRFAAALGGYVRSLHQAGLYPQDLRAANVIARQADDRWEFVLVDLDRVRAYRVLSVKRRIKNLVQLERSVGRLARAKDQVRFLRSYLGETSWKCRREFVSRVLALTESKDREYRQRRDRPRALSRWLGA